jgi:hypothetical protein
MSIFYVTKDIERATGIDLERYPEVYILANKSPLADLMHQKFPDRVLLNTEKNFNTQDLLKHYAVYIEKIDPQPKILVFKNSRQIERFCSERNWQLLNPAAELSEKFERKISQHEWFKTFDSDIEIPDTVIDKLEKLKYQGLVERFGQPFILQYNIGHTGESTKHITSPYDLEQEIQKTPKRLVKVVKHLKGEIYTINACVGPNNIYLGQISLQLTGLPDLTDNTFATVGNDWAKARKIYNLKNIDNSLADNEYIINKNSFRDEYIPAAQEAIKPKSLAEQIKNLTRKIAQRMRDERWLGLFGVDVLVQEQTHKHFLIEINARQPASSTFETQLTHLQNAAGPLDWQLHCLANVPLAYPERQVELKATQVFLRKTTGPVYDKYKNIIEAQPRTELGSGTGVGEYDQNLKLAVEKPIFDLPADSDSIFIAAKNTEKEMVRIQTNKNFLT